MTAFCGPSPSSALIPASTGYWWAPAVTWSRSHRNGGCTWPQPLKALRSKASAGRQGHLAVVHVLPLPVGSYGMAVTNQSLPHRRRAATPSGPSLRRLRFSLQRSHTCLQPTGPLGAMPGPSTTRSTQQKGDRTMNGNHVTITGNVDCTLADESLG